MKRILLNGIIVAVVGIVLVVLVFFTEGLDGLVSLFVKIDYLWMGAAFLILILYWALGTVTLGIIKKGMLQKADPGHNMKINMVGVFFNGITPFATGGQPAQVYLMNRMGIDSGIGSSIVIVKSFLHSSLLFLYALVFWIARHEYLTGQIPGIYPMLVFAATINLLLISFYLMVLLNEGAGKNLVHWLFNLIVWLRIKKDTAAAREKINVALYNFTDGVRILKKKPGFFLVAILTQAAQLFAFFAIPVILHRAIEGDFSQYMNLFICTAMLILISSMIPTPGSTIGAEGLALLFIAKFFIGSPALAVVLIWRVVTYYAGVLAGGIVCMFIPDRCIAPEYQKGKAYE
ncbi:MAG: flippase-like domain-containing protein [Clostridia bacterium]